MSENFKNEVDSGSRFEFGENWSRFLSQLNETRILEAVESLKKMLSIEDLKGKTFLDVGSGSGLFSLAAKKLGAKVHSFDYDPKSVACARELKKRYFPQDEDWTIEEGSVLDEKFMGSLNKYDIVYSWGVLHHTGEMWKAMELAQSKVKSQGLFFIALYNDQGIPSIMWKKVKKLYLALPRRLRFIVVGVSFIRLWGIRIFIDTLKLSPLKTWKEYHRHRGMSAYHDVIDWVGGYPFEVSKPEEVFEFCKARGFKLQKLKTCGGKLGCNEYVFERD
jgi:2-polyprenyl-3-methyl-5-hydroxy-6-metoxy-1,4-benzoquinol methylase